jgi:hypothetical protein
MGRFDWLSLAVSYPATHMPSYAEQEKEDILSRWGVAIRALYTQLHFGIQLVLRFYYIHVHIHLHQPIPPMPQPSFSLPYPGFSIYPGFVAAKPEAFVDKRRNASSNRAS